MIGIFEHQEEVTADTLHSKVLEFAKTHELDELNLTRCMDTKGDRCLPYRSPWMKARPLVSVPRPDHTFVNGRKLVGAVDWPSLKRIIDYELEYQKTAKNAGEDCGCEVTLPTPGFK